MENTMEQPKKERIFISYKRVDKDRVFAIKNRIENATGEKCWIDIDGIESCDAFRKVIMNAIKECEVFLFMYSQHHTHIDTDSDWTMREIDYAARKKKRVVIVKLDNVEYFDEFDFAYGHKQYVNADDSNMMEHLFADMRSWLKDVQETKQEEVVESEEKTQPEPPRTESSQPQESTTPTRAQDSKRKIKAASIPTPKKKEKKSQDKVVTTTKKVDGKQTAKKAAIAAGVVAGTLLFPAGAAIVGTAVGAKKLWDKYKKKK